MSQVLDEILDGKLEVTDEGRATMVDWKRLTTEEALACGFVARTEKGRQADETEHWEWERARSREDAP